MSGCPLFTVRASGLEVFQERSSGRLGVRTVQGQTVWAGSYSSYRFKQSSSSVSIGQTPRAITLAPGGADGWLTQSEPSGHKAQEMVQNMAALFRGSGALDIVLNGPSGKLQDFTAYKSQRCVKTKASKHPSGSTHTPPPQITSVYSSQTAEAFRETDRTKSSAGNTKTESKAALLQSQTQRERTQLGRARLTTKIKEQSSRAYVSLSFQEATSAKQIDMLPSNGLQIWTPNPISRPGVVLQKLLS
ncbi:hypothetical protein MHYP_G00117490 [Metynnis hypsauchen]